MKENASGSEPLSRHAFRLDRSSLKAEFGEGMNVRYGRMIRERRLYGAALDLAADPDPQVAFRAAWALEQAVTEAPQEFLPFSERILAGIRHTTVPGVQRSFLKIVLLLIQKKLFLPAPEERDALVTVAFDRLIDPAAPVAVQALSVRLLDRLSPLPEWAREEFGAILLRLSQSQSPGLTNCSAKMLKKRKR